MQSEADLLLTCEVDLLLTCDLSTHVTGSLTWFRTGVDRLPGTTKFSQVKPVSTEPDLHHAALHRSSLNEPVKSFGESFADVAAFVTLSNAFWLDGATGVT